jgi:hypothetical protein
LIHWKFIKKIKFLDIIQKIGVVLWSLTKI